MLTFKAMQIDGGIDMTFKEIAVSILQSYLNSCAKYVLLNNGLELIFGEQRSQ